MPVFVLCCSFTGPGVAATAPQLVDAQATPETRALFLHLQQMAGRQILFGHQHTTCYGVGWNGDDLRSDVKDVTGSFPAVYGWDWGHPGTDHLATLMIEAFERGGVNTISWHMKYPVAGGTYQAAAQRNVKEVLPGGALHDQLKKELDGFAAFISSLKDRRGRTVPVIFRPWHEHTGSWFWWGTANATPEEFVALWRFTVTYLRDTRHVHNLLWAYSPSRTGVSNAADYTTNRFPGFAYIDIVGLDYYTTEDTGDLVTLCRTLVELAGPEGKVPALTEFGWIDGFNNSKRNDWYTACFLAPLKRDPVASGIAWALTWRNESPRHFWVPYPGHPAEKDFRAFFDDPMTAFEDDLPDLYAPQEINADPSIYEK